MKYLKFVSFLMAVAMCMSFVMTPVLVTADETEASAETTETTEVPENKETEAVKETAEEPSGTVPEITETEPSVQNKAIKERSKEPGRTAKSSKKNAGETHTITVMPVSHGKVTFDKYEGAYGEKIYFTATPDPGYYYFGLRYSGTSAYYFDNYVYIYDTDLVLEFCFFEMISHPVGYEFQQPIYSYKITNNAVNGTGTVKCTGFFNLIDPNGTSSARTFANTVIPATIRYDGVVYKVTAIDSNAFKDNKYIQTVTIGSNVTSIGNNAFDGCSNLSKVSGGAKLKTIGSKAFARCPKLSSFKISSKVLSKIGSYAFNKDSKLKTIYIKSTTKLKKKGVKKSLKGSKVKTVKVKKSKVKKYRKFFTKKNCGRKVKVKK